jgi:hypothetical protein
LGSVYREDLPLKRRTPKRRSGTKRANTKK